MSRAAAALALAALGRLLLAGPLQAQTIAAGDWRGPLLLPDGDSLRVTLTIARPKTHPEMTIRATSGLEWGMAGVRERSGRLEFSWALDSPQPLLCRLSSRRADLWEGYCDDTVRGADGKFLRLFLTIRPVPPAGP